MKTFKIYTLGCKVNQYDSSSLGRKLLEAGFVVSDNEADLAIINTCSVTKTAIAKDKKMVEKARKENPQAKLAVVGCLPVNYKEVVEELNVDYVCGPSELPEFVKTIIKDQLSMPDENSMKIDSCEMKIDKSDRSRYFMKVQDGCQQFCSYCIIPYNRGKLSSRPMDEVLREAREVVAKGYKEIILCGIHLGLYGVDLGNDCHCEEKGSNDAGIPGQAHRTRDRHARCCSLGMTEKLNLVSLLKELIKIEDLEKIRLSSIEVIDVSDELIDLMARERKLCRHLHIPLQAGTDKILKLMNRPYTTEYFKNKIAKLREVMPEIAITTDVIVGFPHETDEDFAQAEAFIRQINFSKLHVFPFSAHEKTPAYKMPEQVKQEIKKARQQELSKLSIELERKYKQQFLNQEVEVIIDGRSKNGVYRGKTEYYFDIEFTSSEKYKVGELVKVKNWRLL